MSGDGFSHDCPPSRAGEGDVACDACGTAWRWVQEDEQRGYWRELTPAELLGERDRARDIAVALEQQTAEAPRIARGCFFPERDVRPSMLVNRASIVELLRVLETENQ